MKTLKTSTKEQLNNLIEFRQTIYKQILKKEGDSQFELTDAMLQSEKVGCIAELSLKANFRREWSSVYQALKRGEQDQEELRKCFIDQVPLGGIQVYALDTTMWAHPKSRTLSGQVYGPSPTKSIKKPSIVQGHQYSLLSWTPEPGRSWTLTISNQRLRPEEKAIEVGLGQVKALCEGRQRKREGGLDVIVADGHYGNHHFLGSLQALDCVGVARLRRDRVLYGLPGPYQGSGRPPVHGQRFAFKEPDSWSEPDEQVELQHARWGQVRLRRFNNLHAKQEASISFDVILAEVHLERDQPPKPLWLGYVPGHTDHSLDVVWGWFDYRWPVEPSIQCRKQVLHWTLPRLQVAQACDLWTNLVDIAFWQLFLARSLVQDMPLPWQKPQTLLSPYRVKRGFAFLFAQIGSPALPPKTRGKSPGWPTSRPRTKPQRFKPVKRGKSKSKSA